MQLLPRGLSGDGGEKTASPLETPPPLPPKPWPAAKPAVLPKPQVRIQTLCMLSPQCIVYCVQGLCDHMLHISVLCAVWLGLHQLHVLEQTHAARL